MKTHRLVAVIAVALLVATGCTGRKGGGGEKKEGLERLSRGTVKPAGGQITIGLSTQDAENQYWLELADEFKKVAAKKGVKVIFAAKYDPTAQAQIVENFIEQGVDAIAVSPVDPAAIQPQFEKAKEQRILVINNHFPTDQSAYDVFVDTGPYESGEIAGTFAADYINDKLAGKAEVAVFTLPENETLTTRVQGIVDAVKKKAPGAKIVAQQRVQSQEDAVKTTENILTAHPNVKVWLGWSDFVMLGAVAGLEGLGKDPKEHVIVGIDATCDAVKAMKAGTMKASVDNPPRPFAQLDFDIIYDLLTNPNSPWNFVKHAITKLQLVDETNLSDFEARCNL